LACAALLFACATAYSADDGKNDAQPNGGSSNDMARRYWCLNGFRICSFSALKSATNLSHAACVD
jgi:hypothetical protein